MLEKSHLRKTDIFSGGIIFLFGLWIVSQALKMPMKDSWGGVQNVWFVSPALFPLFVGAMISILGILLARKAFKEVGWTELKRVLKWFSSLEFFAYMTSAPVIRFYAMAVLFFSYVFLNLPRIDFFLCSILFLAVFISMFYFDDDLILKKLFYFYLLGTLFFLFNLLLQFSGKLTPGVAIPNDWFASGFIVGHFTYTWALIRRNPVWRKKYRTVVILAIVPTFLICSIFKYFLLVPMPTEGLVSTTLDAVWYWAF